MRRTLFRAAAAAAALLVAAGAWIFLVESGDQPAPEAPPAEPPPPARAAQGAAPRTAPDDGAGRARVDEVAQPSEEPEPPPPVPPHALLDIVLEGLDPDVPAAPTIVTVSHGKQGNVVDADDAPVTQDCGTAARFRVDVSSLVPASGGLTVLDVIAEREGYLTATGGAHTAAPRDPSKGPSVATVQLRLQAAGWVRGVVQDERFRRVENADVGAFVMRQNRYSRVDVGRTNAEGVFRLRLHPGETHLIAVAAKDLEPASSQVTGLARAETELTPFTLRPGLAISGEARHADGSALLGARVLARPVWAETDLHLRERPLAYRAGQALLCPAGVEVDGVRFALRGLVPGDYDVSLFVESAAANLLATTRRRVQPPVEELAIVLAPSTLVVEATVEDRPLARVRFTLRDAEGVATAESDDLGEARFLVSPRSEYELAASPPGYFPVQRIVRSGGANEPERVRVEFRRSAPPSRLVLRLRPEDASGAEPVVSAMVEVQEVDRPGVAYRTETVAFGSGWGEIVGLPQGAYLLVVKPTPEGCRLPARHRVGVAEGGVATLGVRFPPGGRLCVLAKRLEGDGVVPGRAFIVTESIDTGHPRFHSALSATAECNDAAGVLLPPGVYDVEIDGEAGDRRPSVRMRAAIHPGKTTTLTARIPPLPATK